MSDQTVEQQANGDRHENAGSLPFVNRADLGITVVVLAVCGWLYWLTNGFDEPSALLG